MLSSLHMEGEILGPVVPVDDEDFRRASNSVPFPEADTLSVPVNVGVGPHDPKQSSSGQSGPGPKKPHQIVSSTGDVILHTFHGGPNYGQSTGPSQFSHPGIRKPPKFSAIVNEYMGACLEDNCQIGEWNTFDFLNDKEPPRWSI